MYVQGTFYFFNEQQSHPSSHHSPVAPTQGSDTGFGHMAAALPMKTKREIIHPNAPESFSGILVDQQKFGGVSTPATNLPVLEFRVSDSRAHYLGWGTGSSYWFYSPPVTMESNLNNYSLATKSSKTQVAGRKGNGKV